ncbi:MAG: Crp/Fnr family transcriptional regulator [Anaerolineae bacterium]|jgi:CRP-like cAMP-binding protein|nr:Crp/Fnr family transcriptional regulator [Anaerolineae bacterium]MBT7188731.1 Crp/Fnr family transcriptional regulator [Anaerolineae bacterium]MBT7600212.1 Crp/Fnr family transcriptional regulator [Anaerolineae bacterium]MBT7991250.1 Crp/Fnr family transcriptional regulator [Anaerolineae bacterium]
MNKTFSTFTQKLARDPIFASLPASDLEKLAHQASLHTYAKDEWVVHNGDTWPYLLWVESGKINALKESGEGRSLITTTILPQETFWGLAFFQEEMPMPVALVAEKESKIRLWSREQFLPFLLKNGKMSWEFSRQMVTRMQQASEIVESLAFQAVPRRLANLLLERYSGCGDLPVARDLTLDQMAARIGSTREMVCRALYKFADDGVIEINRTEFLISDESLLEKIAHRD